MRGMSALRGMRPPGLPLRVYLLYSAALVFVSFSTGCVEFSHFGQVMDREAAGPVGAVTIEQRQSDGDWKRIGVTDGKGRWNIFKHEIKGGGNVRLRKQGYRTIVMNENEFLQQANILMTPAMDDTAPEEYLRRQDDFEDR